MNLIFLSHYSLQDGVSMPLFARFIANGMRARGHNVSLWHCPVIFGKLAKHSVVQKWLGYIDQFLLYPLILRMRVMLCSSDTLFVVTDHALGPWVPALAKRRHIIHCHDFLAQRSALGLIPENPTSFTGVWYQRLIRRGYRKGRNFVSISEATQHELHDFLQCIPKCSEIVYNGLNYPFGPLSDTESRNQLEGLITTKELEEGFILHVGGNQWYKNRIGVVEIYREYVRNTTYPLPLWLIGREPDSKLSAVINTVESPGTVRVLSRLITEQIHAAYNRAKITLFPSLAEGFGWPIAEAMACGCPVMTTNAAPMTEVADKAAAYIPRRPFDDQLSRAWALTSAKELAKLIGDSDRLVQMQALGILNAQRFRSDLALDAYEVIYKNCN